MTSDPNADRSESPDPTDANKQLFASLYTELRRLADREIRRYPEAAVSPTTLVHEAYLNLINRDGVSFEDPGKCLGYVARAMRGVVIDLARRQQAVKRGAGFHITGLSTEIGKEDVEDISLNRLSEALDELAAVETRLAELWTCGTSADSRSSRSESFAACRRELFRGIGKKYACSSFDT